MKSPEKNRVPTHLHRFLMGFADWLTSSHSKGHPPPFLWITICTFSPAAIAIPFAAKHDDWIGWIAGYIGFGAALLFIGVVLLAVISRLYNAYQKNKSKRNHKNLEI